MKITLALLPILTSCLIFSCGPRNLVDEKEVLIGQWEWVNTLHEYTCFPLDTEWVTPATYDTTFSIEIVRRDKIYFLRDGEVAISNPVWATFLDSSGIFSNGFFFSMHFEEPVIYTVAGHVNEDSLMLLEYWPDPFIDRSCHEYTHYFIKEED